MFDLFSDFFDSFDFYPVYHEEIICPNCKMTYSELQKSGKLGCSECYEVFKNPIIKSVSQIQKGITHTGKIPKSLEGKLKIKKRYEDLKSQIQKAVADEDYETAAKLHKELKELGGEE